MVPLDRPVSRRRFLALRAAVAVAALALSGVALSRLDLKAIGDALAHARLPFVAMATLVYLVQILPAAERWRVMLASVRLLPRARLCQYLLVAHAASMVLLGPAGWVLRIYLVRKRYDVPVQISIAVVAVEKLFDGIGLLVVVAPLPLLLALPRSVSLVIMALTAGGLVVTAVAIAAAARVEKRGWQGWLKRWSHLAPGIESLRSPGLFFRVSALSFAIHLSNVVAIQILFLAVGLDLPLATGGLVVLALMCAFALPLTPGGFGMVEAAAVFALGLVGVSPEKALAFGLVHRAVVLVPMLLGLTGIGLVGEARADQAASAAERVPVEP